MAQIFVRSPRLVSAKLLSLAIAGSSAVMSPTALASDSPECFNQLDTIQSKVSRVSDGDTLVLNDDRRVRLIGINTAELNAKNPALQQAAQRSKRELTTLLPPNTAVRLFLGEESHDRYGRLLAHVVRQSDNLAVGPELLRTGFAVQSAVSPNTKCADYFASLEREAVDKEVGITNSINAFNTRAANLIGDERGFRLITGEITRVEMVKRYTNVFLDDNFRLTMDTHAAKTLQLNRLLGKTVEVRGWLSQRKNKVLLRLQHESNFRLVEE